MRELIASILLLTAFHAASSAEASRREVTSPDKRFFVTITHSASTSFALLTIRDASGKLLFSSDTAPDLNEIFSFYPDGALWSPDGEILAIAGGYDKQQEPFIFV